MEMRLLSMPADILNRLANNMEEELGVAHRAELPGPPFEGEVDRQRREQLVAARRVLRLSTRKLQREAGLPQVTPSRLPGPPDEDALVSAAREFDQARADYVQVTVDIALQRGERLTLTL
jgi:hypothetical protein